MHDHMTATPTEEDLEADNFDSVDAGAEALHRGVDKAREGANTAGNMACRAKERVKKGAHAVNEAVHDHPYGALAVGAGLGILIGVLLRRGH